MVEQKMTRTTELSKGAKKHEKRTSCRAVTWRCELKGRLDALKEEVEFLRNWRCKLNLWIAGLKLKDERIDKFIEIIDIYEDKINFLKEEIKLIEGRK